MLPKHNFPLSSILFLSNLGPDPEHWILKTYNEEIVCVGQKVLKNNYVPIAL